MKHIAKVFLLSLSVALLLDGAWSQEPRPAGTTPQGTKKPAAKASVEKKAGAKASATKKTAKEASRTLVPWGAKQLPVINAINRMRLLKQNNKWSEVNQLSFKVIEVGARAGDLKEKKALLGAGYWYQALIRGREARPDEAMKNLKVAVENGFENPMEMMDEEALTVLHDRDDFKAIVSDLSKRLDERMRKKFTQLTNNMLEPKASVEAHPWSPDLKTLDGQPFWKVGSPSAVIVTRVHHDGLPKLLALLGQTPPGKMPSLGVVFYQVDAKDDARTRQTVEYVLGLREKKLLDPTIPCAIVGQDVYAELTGGKGSLVERYQAAMQGVRAAAAQGEAEEETGEGDDTGPSFNYFPLLVFFDGNGVPVNAMGGIPADWQLSEALSRFQETAGKAVPPPEAKKEEPPKPEESPAKPAAEVPKAPETPPPAPEAPKPEEPEKTAPPPAPATPPAPPENPPPARE